MSLRLLLGISLPWIPLAFLFDGVTVLLLPARLAGLGAEATALGLVSFAGLTAAVALQPFAGMLSDRFAGTFGRQGFMGLAAAPAVLGLWLVAASTPVALVVVGYVVLQVSGSAMQAALQALIPEHVAPARRGRAAGAKAAFDVGGSFVAFLVLGILIASGQTLAVAALVTILLVTGIAAVWLLVPGSRTTRGSVPADRSDPVARRGGLSTRFMLLVLARFLFLLGIFAVGRFLLLLVADRIGADPTDAADEAGALLALLTLATAASAIAFGWLADRKPRPRVMAAGIGLSALGIALFIPNVGLPGAIAAGLLMSLGTAAFTTANWAATTDLAAPADAGRLMGIANLGTGGAAACAGLLGPLIDAAGFTPALLIAATATAAALVPIVLTARAREAVTVERA